MKRRFQLAKPASPFIFGLLVGCATVISHQPAPEGWPQLERRTEYVGFFELQRHCYGYLPLYMKLIGSFAGQCVEINFAARTCTKYRPIDETVGDEHEDDHCDGRDHVGETTLRDALNAWRAANERQTAQHP